MTREEYLRQRRIREERARRKRRKYAIRRLIVLCAGILILLSVILGIVKIFNAISGNNDNAESIEIAETSATAEPTPEPPPPFYDPAVENDLLEITDAIEQLHPEDKICYLTFDDGPSTKVTPQVLDTLAEYNVKATFFVQGQHLQDNDDIARRAYEEGHFLANHSMYHEYSELYASVDSFIDEIEDCTSEIHKIIDEDDIPNYMQLVRFPGGCFDTTADPYSRTKLECKDELSEMGYFEVNWNALTGDAEGAKKTPEELLAYMKRYLSAEQKQVIVLMHDTDAKQNTADALASVIEYMQDSGFEFRGLDEIPYYEDVDDYLRNGTAETAEDTNEDDADSTSETE